MNISSLFHGTLGIITIACVVFILCLFFYAVIKTYLKTQKIIKDCDSLSFPTKEDVLSKTKIGRMLLENELNQTSDYIEDAVSTQSIASDYKLNLRLMQAMPSILTSLGILGTFVGLSVSVIVFDASSSESIRASIKSLLAGMGTAFFTSVCGMSCSVSFLWFERWRYNKLYNSVDSLCARINKHYHRPSGALLDAGLDKISSKIDGIELTFGDNLDKIFDEKVTPVITEISHKLENPAHNIAESLLAEFKKLSDDFSDRLTEKVNDKMNALLEQFILAADEMKGVPAAINTATENLIKSGETTINAQKEFTKETQSRFEKYTDDLTNAVKGQLSAIQQQFDTASENLIKSGETTINAQKEFTKEIQSRFEKFTGDITDSVKEQLSAIQHQFDTASENLIKSGETTINAQKEFTKETQSRFEKYTDDLTNAVKGQLSAIQQQFDSTANTLKGIPEEISRSVEAQKTVTEEFSQQIAKLGSIEEIYSVAIEKITSANQDLANAKSNINTLTEKISSAAASIETASSEMVESNEKMVSNFEAIYKLNKTVTSQVKDYSERISDIEKGLKGIFGEIEKGLNNYASTTSKNMQGMLDTFTSAVTKASQEISNSTSPLHESISGILNALDKTERSAKALLERVEKMPQQKANK